ncbi:hypothetical protein MMC20_005008 [Loxospora ochrophaea]|nr:hypothetical protein [Loxospora ochrophaea]
MIIRLSSLALGAAILIHSHLACCIAPGDIPLDTPIASLISSAKAHLAKGNSNDALTYFDVAISRDPQNYLTIFQRGATYLSLGRNGQANQDFDRVLTIKPDFEGALLQRARIKSRNAEWTAAKQDYLTARKADNPDFAELEAAQGAAGLSEDAEKSGDWEACVNNAGTAILVASTALKLRQRRARCRFERGEVLEGVSDLNHVLQISPSLTEPYLQISAMMFYAMADTDKGLSEIRKCLQSDPDNKSCSKLYRREKILDKVLKQVKKHQERKQYNSAVKLLVGSEEDSSLIQDVKDDVQEAKDSGKIYLNSPNDLYANLIEMTCDFYTEMNNKKRALSYCTEALNLLPDSLPALLSQAQRQLDVEEYESAIHTLNHAKEHHPSASQIPHLLQKAHTLLKRSKSKDYYKVLGVSSDADDRTIKRAFRTMTKQYHPDKAVAHGMSKEDAEKKMAAINEAYEVLSDPELKARFDRGDDPNSQEGQQQPFHGSPFGQGPGGQQFFFKQGPGSGGGGFKFQQGGFQFPGGFGFP